MMLQLQELCRLCAQRKRNKVDLFSEANDEENRLLLTKISLCLSIQVTKEDMLPKMVCVDCQKAVEQFNEFKLKCQRAEEKLNKMLSLSSPNKSTVTQIKQEFVETDFQENNHLNVDFSSSFGQLKSLKNVKLEIEEPNNEALWNQSTNSDLIQIISEEIANQQFLLNFKQPQIEIISENYEEEYKHVNLKESGEYFNSKTISDILSVTEECNNHVQNSDIGLLLNVGENDKELRHADKMNKRTKSRRKSALRLRVMDEIEIDEKYLTLNEGELCDIDLEEMDALIRKKQNPKATFTCKKCSKSFKFFKSFKKHNNFHKLEPEFFICDFCKNESGKKFEFSNLKNLKYHILKKHSLEISKKHQCELCKKVLPSLMQLHLHFKKVHNEFKAACQICGKIFKNKVCLKYHLKVHDELRPYGCDECGMSFKCKRALAVHIQRHKQEKNFLCSKCGKKFSAKKNLIEHLNIHTGERPYVCCVCSATFAQSASYKRHISLHIDRKKAYKCDKCEKNYTYAHLLKRHLISHSGVSPYKCSTCHRTFKFQSSLYSHIKVHKEKQYDCLTCGEKFAVLKTLKVHMVRHTGIKHKCPVPDCEKTYSQRFTLTKHFRKHHPNYSIVGKKGDKNDALSKKPQQYVQYYFAAKDFVGEKE